MKADFREEVLETLEFDDLVDVVTSLPFLLFFFTDTE